MPMHLDSRARAVGRKVGEHTWLAALRNLVTRAPSGLGDVQVEFGPPGELVVALTRELLGEVRHEWWRDLESQVNQFLPGSDPEEAQLLASVVTRLPWHPRKLQILRRLEERAYGLLTPADRGRATPGPAPRRAEPQRRRAGAL